MSQPSPEQVPQAQVQQIATNIQRFMDLLADRGIPDEDDDGRNDGRL
jgi:hypothetical protein